MITRRRIIDNDERYSSKWWLAGGIAEADCTGAWQAINAPNYEASKINLANPGLYNAYGGVPPSWSMNKGWYFVATDYLETGIAINRNVLTKSLIVRFSEHPVSTSYRALAGAWGGTGTNNGRFWLAPEWGANRVNFANGSEVLPSVTGGYSSGVMAVAGTNAFYNNSDVGNILPYNVAGTNNFRIGKVDGLGGCAIAYIQAVAVYAATTITTAQVLAVTNAMNAL